MYEDWGYMHVITKQFNSNMIGYVVSLEMVRLHIMWMWLQMINMSYMWITLVNKATLG